MKDYYQILEIDPNASPEVLQQAYRALVRKHHPDLYHLSDKSRMTGIIQDLNEAYDTLSDPRRRARYDAQRSKQQTAPRPKSWQAQLKHVGFWFMLTFTVLMVLRIGGKLLLLKPVLLFVLAMAFFLTVVRPWLKRRGL